MSEQSVAPAPDKEARRTHLEQNRERLRRLWSRFGLVLLALALTWAVIHVAGHSFTVERREPEAEGGGLLGGKTVVSFAHWQLEGRTVQTMEKACRAYEALHPDVIVKQIPVPERGYEWWVKTQLIGRTAPDLIELRTWKWKTLINRYFEDLSAYVDEPNPYNEGGPLEDQAWHATYRDNMEGGYIDDLKGQFGIPLTIYTTRIYANRDLIETALDHSLPETPQGRPIGPRSLDEFMSWCSKIQALSRTEGEHAGVVPIAGSEYVANIFRWTYFDMGVWGLLDRFDQDYDGAVANDEKVRTFFNGTMDFVAEPHLRAAHLVLYELSGLFNPGFMTAKREDALLQFTQGKAAMIATGSWEAGSLDVIIDDEFEMAIFEFPAADPTNERYGDYLKHPKSEAGTRAGFCFGLTKLSENKEQAIDFMHFLSAYRPDAPAELTGEDAILVDEEPVRVDNETLNASFKWFPAVQGCRPLPLLEPFEPQSGGIPDGVYTVAIDSDVELKYNNAYTAFISEREPDSLDAHYRAFMEQLTEVYAEYAIPDLKRNHNKSYGAIATNEGQLSALRRKAMLVGMEERLTGELAAQAATLILGQSQRTHALGYYAADLAEIEALRAADLRGDGR